MSTNNTHHHHHDEKTSSFWSSTAFLVFLAFGVIAAILLWQEHQAHILGIIPYLFILACPLLHIFMHGGHGGHGKHGRDASNGSGERS